MTAEQIAADLRKEAERLEQQAQRLRDIVRILTDTNRHAPPAKAR